MSPEQTSIVGRGIAWSSVENWGRQILTFAVYTGLARLLDPESFGIVAVAAVYIAFAELFVSQGFGTAIIQRDNLEKKHIDSSFWIGFFFAIVFAALTVILADTVGRLFGEEQLAPVLQVLSLMLVLISLNSIPTALLRRRMDFRSLAIRSLGATTIGGAIGLAMALTGWGVWSLVALQIVKGVVSAAVLWWAVEWRPSVSISIKHLKDIYGFAASILGNNILWFFSQRSDQTIVGYVFGAVALGPYSLAAKVIDLTRNAVGGPLQAVALPMLARLQKDQENLKRHFLLFSEGSALLSFPIFTGLAVTANEFVPMVFGTQWTRAVPILQWLCLYGALRVAFSFIHPLMLAQGRPGMYLIMFVIDTLTTILVCLGTSFLSPPILAAGLALNTLAGVFLVLPFFQKVMGVSVGRLLAVLSRPASLALAMGALVTGTRYLIGSSLPPVVTFLISVAIGTVAYFTLLLIFHPQRTLHFLRMASRQFGFLSTREVSSR